jgi:hypothetical protein
MSRITNLLGLSRDRAETIAKELSAIRDYDSRVEDACSFDGPERDYAMYLVGNMEATRIFKALFFSEKYN